MTIALPANTGLGSFKSGSTSSLDVGAAQVGYCEPTDDSSSTPTVTCYVNSGDTIAALHHGHGHPQRRDQPAGRLPTLAVSTSSDVTPVSSPSYPVTVARSVGGVGVTITPPTSAARRADHLRGQPHHVADRRP